MPLVPGVYGIETFPIRVEHKFDVRYEAIMGLSHNIDIVVRHKKYIWTRSIFCRKPDVEIRVTQSCGRSGSWGVFVQNRDETVPEVDLGAEFLSVYATQGMQIIGHVKLLDVRSQTLKVKKTVKIKVKARIRDYSLGRGLEMRIIVVVPSKSSREYYTISCINLRRSNRVQKPVS